MLSKQYFLYSHFIATIYAYRVNPFLVILIHTVITSMKYHVFYHNSIHLDATLN